MDLDEAAARGDVHRVRELLSTSSTYAKNEALRYAAANGYTQIVELLLAAGANGHFNYYAALRYASENGHTQVVELLLFADVNVHAWDDYALILAAKNGHTQVIELLLLADADIRVLPLHDQQRFKHLIPIYISIQEYLMLETLIINIMELADRFIVDVIPNKKYVILK